MTEPTTEEKRFIEDVGLLFEDSGMPRMAGRIFGWLLICDPPHQSAGELTECVGGSKGSISTMTRMLMNAELVERLTLPGERSTYYQIKRDAWAEMLNKKAASLSAWREAAERGLELLKDAPPESHRRLHEMREVHAFFEKELPRLIEAWQKSVKDE